MATRTTKGEGPIIIKKYANRRLYNTDASVYVTLDDLRALVREDVDFIVQDAKTGEDLTRAVLTQILVEAEQGGDSLLPIGFLRQIIAMYGNSMSGLVMPQYLECVASWFEENQAEMHRSMEGAAGGTFVPPSMEAMQEAAQRNMSAFNDAMQSFWPQFMGSATAAATGKPAEPAAKPSPTPADAGLSALRDQLAAMQKQLDSLGKN